MITVDPVIMELFYHDANMFPMYFSENFTHGQKEIWGREKLET
jgi:hypothetical protein